MNRRERLMTTLQGRPVDRPAVCFYEINGLDENPDDPDPFNIYTHPSWAPLLELARQESDRIVMRTIRFKNSPADPVAELTKTETWHQDGTLFTRNMISFGYHSFSSITRRDPDVNTIWQVEHWLKDLEDLKAWLQLPQSEPGNEPDLSNLLAAEQALGDSGIVMIDTPDPLCEVAALFDLGTYTILATAEPTWFHLLLERYAERLYPQIEAICQAAPGRLWRIYGPEYASPPYLHPRLFREYVVRYVTPMVQMIQRSGGFARIHCHGRIKHILQDIVATGCDGLDPIEPPPQGDIELYEVRQQYGQQLVLFGNLEASDLETLPLHEFEKKIRKAIQEGTAGEGRGFVLMPSSCPYGRELSLRTLRNYEKMVEVVADLSDS